MKQAQQVLALAALGWTFRRIERETGVRRETVSRYVREADSKAAKVFPGSGDAAIDADAANPGESGTSASPADSNPAKVFAGSGSKAAEVFSGSRSSAALYGSAIREKRDAGLSVQRIFQDLQDEYGYGHSYESVKRYVRRLEPARRAAVGVMHAAPGEEVSSGTRKCGNLSAPCGRSFMCAPPDHSAFRRL